MAPEKQDVKNWEKVQAEFMVKCLEEKPRFLPSGKLVSKEKLDYRDVIEKASRSMIRFKKPERLIRMIVRIIAEQVRVMHTGVLLYKEKNDSYVLIDSKGAAGKKIPIGYVRIPSGDYLISEFTEKNSILLDEHSALTHERIEGVLNNAELVGKYPELKNRINRINAEMALLRADICIPAYFKKKLLGILILGVKLSGEKFDDNEIGFFATLANDVAMAITNAQLIATLKLKIKEIGTVYEQQKRLFIHTSIALAAAIDARDPYTHGHTERVTHYSLKIANEMADAPGIVDYPNFKEVLHIASLLHDIGKIGITDNILNKNKKLDEKEYEEVKKHCEIGATILKPIRELGSVIEIVKAHHERYDGTGYPDGLKGNNIPLLARIIAVADVFDTMTTDRPYQKRKFTEEAAREIEKNSGTQFDPAVVKAFLKAYHKGADFLPPSYSKHAVPMIKNGNSV